MAGEFSTQADAYSYERTNGTQLTIMAGAAEAMRQNDGGGQGDSFRDRIKRRLTGAPTTAESQQLPVDRSQQQVPVDRAQAQQPGDTRRITDAAVENPVRNGVLELSYNDANFARKMASAQGYWNIKINDLPEGVKLKHWVDETGYFFFFEGSSGQHLMRVRTDDGRYEMRYRPYYYQGQAKQIEHSGQVRDLEATRLKINRAITAGEGSNNGFTDFTKLPSSPAGRVDVFTYYMNLSQIGARALDISEKSLTDAVRNGQNPNNPSDPTNPYFRIYLADIKVARAIQPIIRDMRETGRANLNNPETIARLNEAIGILSQVKVDSNNGLTRINQYTPGNILMPGDPFSIIGDPRNRNYYYGFWGGSYDQAKAREAGLVMLRDLLQSGAFPTDVQLPPSRPPIRF